jgi:hypothetical protein
MLSKRLGFTMQKQHIINNCCSHYLAYSKFLSLAELNSRGYLLKREFSGIDYRDLSCIFRLETEFSVRNSR